MFSAEDRFLTISLSTVSSLMVSFSIRPRRMASLPMARTPIAIAPIAVAPIASPMGASPVNAEDVDSLCHLIMASIIALDHFCQRGR
jgi:hypothetical protein